MARLVKVVEDQSINCTVTTIFKDGTSTTKILTVGDVVTGLRYIEDEEVKTVTGKVVSIDAACNTVTKIDMNDPIDNFSNDVIPTTIQIDASHEYESKVVNVPAMEIVEDEGVFDVVKVDIKAVPKVVLEMTYTDGQTIHQDLEVGDILCDMVIKTNPKQPDITGDFKLSALNYTSVSKKAKIVGLYLSPLSGGKAISGLFENIISFVEKPASTVTESDSLSQLATALSEQDEVFAFLDTDVTVPKRDDGRITTLMVNEGKTLTVDLSGHSINTEAYAFYVNGGTLTIRDTQGTGCITAKMPNNAYPAVFVSQGGTCNMESGTIDVSQVELHEGDYNWLYGVVCSGNGIFNMTGGEIITGDAAGISITNGTAAGQGAQFNIGGTATITSKDCTAIYLADNKAVNISDSATINGGILLRLGDLNISGKATINGAPADADIYPLGVLACESGCENHNAAILALTGCYNSALGNDLNINITDSAVVKGNIDNAIDIATLNTKVNQKVRVNIKSMGISYVDKLWNVYDHNQVAEMSSAQGKTLPAETSTTDLIIKVDGSEVYPVD